MFPQRLTCQVSQGRGSIFTEDTGSLADRHCVFDYDHHAKSLIGEIFMGCKQLFARSEVFSFNFARVALLKLDTLRFHLPLTPQCCKRFALRLITGSDEHRAINTECCDSKSMRRM